VLSRALGEELAAVDHIRGDPGAAVEQFLRLEAAGWKGRAGTALLCRPAHTRFFRDTTARFAAHDRLMLLSLQAGDAVVAQSTALVGGSGLFGFKKAYDEAYASCSPGALLELDVLAWLHHDGRLEWLDSCSSPEEFRGALGDRREGNAASIALTPLGTALARALPAALNLRSRLGVG